MPDLTPTGWCFCGCGGATKPSRFFVQTHDRVAETAVIREKYGSIAAFVVAHGYGPDTAVPGASSGL
jgi:hypothetical protein